MMSNELTIINENHEQLQRNIEKLPEDMVFQLTKADEKDLWSQFVTTNISPMSRSLPYAFTEQGIYMLMTVLKGGLINDE